MLQLRAAKQASVTYDLSIAKRFRDEPWDGCCWIGPQGVVIPNQEGGHVLLAIELDDFMPERLGYIHVGRTDISVGVPPTPEQMLALIQVSLFFPWLRVLIYDQGYAIKDAFRYGAGWSL